MAMSNRVFNFSAGPAGMPQSVLEAASRWWLDYEGRGVGIAEVSHRGPEFDAVRQEAERACRELLGIGDDYAVLFLQGGATQQFELVPMNLLRPQGWAAYIDSGLWAAKAAKAAPRYGTTKVLASSKDDNYVRLPHWDPTLAADADYLHICSNNTIFGTRFSRFPEHPCLVADMSSEIMSRPIDLSRFGLIYAGAQKNLGPAGVVLVVVRRDLLERAADLPPIFSYKAHAEAYSCLNTPPTFGVAVLACMFRWLAEQGGVAAMAERNRAKAELLYQAIDASQGFYRGTVVEPADRSHMNVTYVLGDETQTKAFLAGAEQRQLVSLKGYRSVGGVRASIYNAMPMEGVERLVEWMDAFRRR